jgi:sirohydrochlorin ferrochelatase
MKKGIVLVGHGSRLPFNREVLEYHAARIKNMEKFSEVKVAFINQKPGVSETIEEMNSKLIYLVPVFISHGVHTLKDLPASLGLSSDTGEIDGKTIVICDPIGTDEMITQVIIRMVEKKKEE